MGLFRRFLGRLIRAAHPPAAHRDGVCPKLGLDEQHGRLGDDVPRKQHDVERHAKQSERTADLAAPMHQ
jgi:hypothetical protein